MTIDKDDRASWVKHRVDGYWRLGKVEELACLYTLIDENGIECGHVTIPHSLLAYIRQTHISLTYGTSDEVRFLEQRIHYLGDQIAAKDKRIAELEQLAERLRIWSIQFGAKVLQVLIDSQAARIKELEEVMSDASELEILYHIDNAKVLMGQKPSGLYEAKLRKYAQAIRRAKNP